MKTSWAVGHQGAVAARGGQEYSALKAHTAIIAPARWDLRQGEEPLALSLSKGFNMRSLNGRW